jgi:hypothetical protein
MAPKVSPSGSSMTIGAGRLAIDTLGIVFSCFSADDAHATDSPRSLSLRRLRNDRGHV